MIKNFYHRILILAMVALVAAGISPHSANGQALTLTSPNGGENWLTGTTQTITWTNSGDTADIMIEYTEDGGTYWYYLGYVLGSGTTGEFTFENYIYPTETAKIRVSYYSDPSVFDESDGYFTVTESPVYFNYPYSGQEFYRGAPVLISWYSYTITSFNLEYSLDNGSSWNGIVSDFSGYEYTWTAPDVLSDQTMLRISDASDPTLFGLSPTFAIVEIPTLTLVSPNGGETWNYGETATVEWTGTNLPDYLYLEYSTDNGLNWNYLGYGYGTETGGSAGIYVPYDPSEEARVRVYDPSYEAVSDISDQSFTIFVPPVIMYYPSAGQSYYIKSQAYISWLSTGISTVNIDLSTDGGMTWNSVDQGIDASYGYYNWIVGGVPSASCLIKVSDASDPSKFGLSGMFTLLATPVITLTSPAGGEVWKTGSAQLLSWNYDNPSSYYIYLEYSSDGGSTWNYINYAENTPGGGSYDWIAPQTESDAYMVRASDYYLSFVSDTSEIFSVRYFPETPICIVTVDSTTNQNVIAWEKPFSDLIDRFIVYKETNETGVYEPLGTVDYDSPAVFTDTNSNPAVKSYRYKLGFTDAAGRTFPTSEFHQSIHLSINQGVGNTWNLIWTSYLGIDVVSYNIYRSVNGEQYSQIASISSSFNSYTDLTAPQGNIYYIVEVPNPSGCEVQLRSGSLNSSLSNIATNNFLDVEETEEGPIAGIYPNPADQGFTLELNGQASEDVTVELYDLTGRNIYSRESAAGRSSSAVRFSTSGIPDGVYMLKVLSGSSVYTRKVVVKH